MGALRQVALLIALLLVLLVAAVGGFYLLGPLLQGPALSTLVSGGDQVEATTSPTPDLVPRGAPSRTPFATAAPTPLPLPSPTLIPVPLPTLAPIASPLPSPTPTREPTSTPTATQTQVATETVVTAAAARILVAPTNLALSEPDGSGTFTISLSTEPVAAVTIPLSTSGDQCSVSTPEVTLDRDNWRNGTSVTVLAADDDVADGEQACLVQTGAASSSGADYGQMSIDDVAVTVEDDETAGIVIAPTNLALSEPEGSGTFTISLSTEPVAAVTIPLSASSDQCSVSPPEVTLDRDNWRNGATVTVRAADDDVADGEQACLVQIGAASSSGADYDQMSPDDVAVTVEDDETAGIVIAPTNLALSEPDGSGTFTISLSTEPIDTVAVSITADGQTTVSPTQITFTQSNWSVEQPVVVVAVDDDVAEGKHSSSIGHAVNSPDENYAAVAIGNVTVEITDNDTTGVAVVPTEVQVLEGGAPQSYQVVLTSQPAVSVTISAIADEHITVSPTLLTFTEMEWNVPQTVTIMTVDDEVAMGPLTSTISHISSSNDGGYLGASISDVTARVTDNDVSGEVVTTPATTAGIRPMATVQAMLAGQPRETPANTTESEAPAETPKRPIRVSPELIFVVILAIAASIFELAYARASRDLR